MKASDSIIRRSAASGLMVVIVAAVTLEASSLIQQHFAEKGMRQEADLRAQTQLENTRSQIMDVVDQAEAAVRNNTWVAQWCLYNQDSLHRVAMRLVQDNPVVMGSTVALVPGYSKSHPLYSPYVCRTADTLELKSLATAEYDYPSQEWFTKPIETGSGYWSEPYLDEGGGETLMTTYSVPIRDNDGNIAAVLTADISLDWLSSLISNIEVYPHAFSMVFSHSGQIMVAPVDSLVMSSTIHDLASRAEDSTLLFGINKTILSGNQGSIEVRFRGNKNIIYYAPVERTGWAMSIVIPENEIYGTVKRLSLFIRLLQLLGIVMLILILRSVAKNQLKWSELKDKKDRMESELRIGSNIQMSMIPKTFPPFPERHDIDMSAFILPAKEVGGDLYDFYIRDEHLFFCIGDVSGKGVPASLVMAITRTLFRNVSAKTDSPANIITQMNDSMAEMNDSNMFVTFFCGVLDLASGHLRYCNAGHNAPLIFTNAIHELPVEPNLPLGIIKGMAYIEQETQIHCDDALFLYTDGLTEAENSEHDLFGEERMMEVLHERRSAQAHLEAVHAAVSKFVGDAPQSDDLTMLFIHYIKPDSAPQPIKRSLTITNEIGQLSLLEEFIRSAAAEKGLGEELTNSLNLAMEEAVTNVILYAYPEGTEGRIDIDATVREDSLEFSISDSGSPFDPTAAPEADITLGVDERPIGGLGIYLVRKLMDSVSYERTDGKNKLTLTKKL